MGSTQPNKLLLEHLYNVLVLGQKPASVQTTPPGLNLRFTPNQKFLQAAAAYADAHFLKGSGTDASQATRLAQLCFQVQEEYGHHCIPHDPSQKGLGPTGAIETLTPTHAQLWHAGGAALLYCALQAGDSALISMAQRWWRAEAALNHLTAWQTNWNLGSYQVIAPGARGGSAPGAKPGDDGPPPAPHNATRDLDYELLLMGSLSNTPMSKIQDQYYTATLILLKLPAEQLAALNKPGSGSKLLGPGGKQGPWTVEDVPSLPFPLFVRRSGNQHSAWFEELDALEPQLQAGVKAGDSTEVAWYNFYNTPPADLQNGGKSPWPAPTQPSGTVQGYGNKAG